MVIVAKTMPRVLTKLDLTNANVQMDILANFAKPKFPIAPLLNLAHAKMVENVLIILHITLANVNLDLLAKIARQISMIAWIICARYVFGKKILKALVFVKDMRVFY